MSELYLHDTQKREKRKFEPLDESAVTMYVCGPTVYNRVHIGNARPAVVFDVLYRVLRALYPKVTYARNITDIEDKIIKAARDEGVAIEQITDRFAEAYFDDMSALFNLVPDIQPYATQTIPEMISMVESLIAKGHAYAIEDGDDHGNVLFAVKSMPNYGQLSNRELDDMLDGARVEVASYKRYAGDFILWKPSTDDEPGWDSPWGRGRPGWHLECSAMIEKHLGETIDIHGGGRDLVFPHHENEIAQSECAHGGKQFVRHWMHNGYINIDGEKMSKSLGNFRMVNDLLKRYHGETLRFALLSAQYRSELNFNLDLLDQAKATLDTVYSALQSVDELGADRTLDLSKEPFFHALLDDLNTPVALRELLSIARELNKTTGDGRALLKNRLLSCASLIGLLNLTPAEWFQIRLDGDDKLEDAAIDALIAERQQAKLDKNYGRADEIRTQLEDAGVVLEDSREGTRWRWE